MATSRSIDCLLCSSLFGVAQFAIMVCMLASVEITYLSAVFVAQILSVFLMTYTGTCNYTCV